MVTAKEKGIRKLGLFRDCSPSEIRWIARTADELDVPTGRELGAEGESVREFIVIVDGVAAATDGRSEVLLGPGAFCGSAELLSDRSRIADVEARTPLRVLVFGVRGFRSLIDRVPSVRRKILADLSARIREANQDELSMRAVS